MKYKHFEELPCWQKARELCRAVSDLINSSGISSDFSLRNQIWKASGSVMDNIAEGFDDGSSAEFVRFLGYAQRSCSEVQSQLYRALDCKYINNEQFQQTDKGFPKIPPELQSRKLKDRIGGQFSRIILEY